MTQPRSTLISLEATPYYHCISRCVRRAWLCGQDKETGRSFDHRKPWLVERFKFLSDVFAINIAAYAVMSNHYHLVLHVDVARAESWSKEDVVTRWTRLYRGPKLAHRYLAGESLADGELQKIEQLITVWRSRLYSVSWFMSCLNYNIALQANKEDGCTGRFWQGRFKSQALLDETALLSCMAYVDLNPIRAGIATSLDESDFTSIQERIRQIQDMGQTCPEPQLMPFGENAKEEHLPLATLPHALQDYLELVDWTGRAIRGDKKGFIKLAQPRLLSTLKLSEQQWRVLALEIQKKSILMLHGLDKLEALEKQGNQILAA
jgi:REP element-mobilizing transposase RayT